MDTAFALRAVSDDLEESYQWIGLKESLFGLDPFEDRGGDFSYRSDEVFYDFSDAATYSALDARDLVR